MLDSVLSQIVATAIAEAQRPLVAELAAVRGELGEARRELGELRRALEQPGGGGELVYLTVAQVAERVGVCQRTVKRWLEDGRLPHVRLPGGGIRVAVAELERVLRESAKERGGGSGMTKDLSIPPDSRHTEQSGPAVLEHPGPWPTPTRRSRR